MYKREICGAYFASEQAFIDHVRKNHEQKALDKWMDGGGIGQMSDDEMSRLLQELDTQLLSS